MVTTTATSESSVVTAAKMNAAGNEVTSRASASLLALNESPVVEVDVLEQLKTNLAQLEDLHARLRFVMSEISYLLKR